MRVPRMGIRTARADERRDHKERGSEQRRDEAAKGHSATNLSAGRGFSRPGSAAAVSVAAGTRITGIVR